jgi:hypothetical protein
MKIYETDEGVQSLVQKAVKCSVAVMLHADIMDFF